MVHLWFKCEILEHQEYSKSMEKECLYHTYLLNSRKATAPTFSGMCTYLPVRKGQPDGSEGSAPKDGCFYSTVMPKNWEDFPGIDDKNKLFAFLSPEAIRLPLALLGDGKELYVQDGSGVLCSPAESCPPWFMLTRGGWHSFTSACVRWCAKRT